MKYNPKINEDTCRLPGFLFTHPLQPIETVQGNLALMYQMQEWLKEISGIRGCDTSTCRGRAWRIYRRVDDGAYHKSRGDDKRTKMLIPDAAHGTNPASVGMLGMTVVTIPSDERGNVDLKKLEAACDDTVVGMMLTNPNTLGMFDEHIEKVVSLVQGCGGLMYGDGANLNAAARHRPPRRPGLRRDALQPAQNLLPSRTAAADRASGPVGVSPKLVDFLP
jgi:glycine dehydrogenase subunit 2